jgi:hypothetical protein
VYCIAEGKYKVTVYTGDVDNAGTDANVHIVLYGEKGNSGQPHKLDNSKNNFERNSVDEFFVEIPKPLGKLTHIHIAQDKSGIASAWFLGQSRGQRRKFRHFLYISVATLD